MNIFTLITPLTYFVLVVLWCLILFYISREYRSLKDIQSPARILVGILAIDSIRTLFESIYFGSWYSARVGFLPQWLFELLVQPQNVFIPKAINVISAALIFTLLIRKWLPELDRVEKKQKKQIASLKESELRFRLLSNATSEGVTITENGVILDANPTLITMFGLNSVEEAIGKHAIDFTAEEYKKTVKQHMLSGSDVQYEVVGLRKDGSKINLEVREQKMKIGDRDLRLTALRDITERKNSEKILQVAHDRFKIVMDSIESLVYVADIETYELLFLNRYGIDLFGDGVGNPCWKILQKEQDKPCPFCTNNLLINSDGTATQGHKWEFKNTTTNRWYSIFDKAIPWQDGRMVRLEIATDISERKVMEEVMRQSKEAAEQANESKSQFLASMSHDIRTPMNSILGIGEILAETNLDAEQKNYIQIINSAGEGLLALINDILDLSKIEAGEMELEAIPFDLRKLTNSSIEIIKSKALRQGTGISFEIDKTLPNQLIGDPQRLRQILLNFLSNAIKFSEQGKIILTATQVDKKLLRLSVSDTGIGIPEDRIKTIFEPFKQAETSTTRRFGGTGLGLSICQKLVKIMEGKIWVESKPGEGSTFHFEIPLLRVPNIKVQPSQDDWSHVEQKINHTGLSILLADDTEENCMVIEAYLKNTPFKLTIVEDGIQALEQFKKGNFDLVLMDINMPDMDGYEATREIRSWEQKQSLTPTPILALTANAMKDDVNKTRDVGCNLHITKPISKKRLLEALAIFSS
ncbi:MAG: response regulator [Magnetococcales bacterium]|nr:response regulator [Magnetococcales bacterium]